MDPTASSLVRGIADFADHQRWFEFNALYAPMIRSILRKQGLRADQLDDAVQEVYISMLSTIERFQYDRSKGKFRSWLSKIAQRASIAQRRKRTDAPVDPGQLVEAQPGECELPDMDDERVQICLNLARAQFDEHTWLPFYLRVIEETPMPEVERLTGMNRNAVYQAVHRVKLCLREMLERFGDRGKQP